MKMVTSVAEERFVVLWVSMIWEHDVVGEVRGDCPEEVTLELKSE